MTKDEALKMAQEVLNLYCEQLNSTFANDALKAIEEALEQPTQNTMLDAASYLLGRFDAHPHQFIGLTDDEALQIYINDPAIASYDDPHLIKYARAIEAKLKDKNHVNTG